MRNRYEELTDSKTSNNAIAVDGTLKRKCNKVGLAWIIVKEVVKECVPR